MVRLSCFHFLSSLLCSDGIWGGLLVRSAEWTLDSGGHTDDLLEPADSAVKYLWSSLVSFCFHFCLILFEYYNKCERVCAFLVMFFCADSVQWGSKTGVDHYRSCQQGFCCSGICLTFCPTHFHIFHFNTF